jgi:hypothetical protein
MKTHIVLLDAIIIPDDGGSYEAGLAREKPSRQDPIKPPPPSSQANTSGRLRGHECGTGTNSVSPARMALACSCVGTAKPFRAQRFEPVFRIAEFPTRL